LSRFATLISIVLTGTTTNNQKNIGPVCLNVDFGCNTKLSARKDRQQTTNVYPLNLLPRSDQPVHVCDNINGEGESATGSDPKEDDDCDIDDYDIDDFLEIPPDLVSKSADLSRYYSESLPQTFKDAAGIKELFPALYLSLTSHTSALVDVCPL
jgi:hypothetical protein